MGGLGMRLFGFFLTIASIFNIYSDALVQQRMAVIVPSYNNKDWCHLNLKSILEQEYQNFYVVYIDDCSTDGTADLVEKLAKEHVNGDKLKLIKNKYRQGALENLWRAIHDCAPEDIVVTIDGDDWLADDQVLSKLNEIYLFEDIWMTYGQFKVYPTMTPGWCSKVPENIVENNLFRKYPDVPSHLRTFKAALFHKIELKDLVSFHGFYPMAWDVAMMIPMIEMASERHKFVKDILYIYNDATPLNDHKVNKQLQSYLSTVLRARKAYQRLDYLFEDESKKVKSVDLLVVSQSSPAELLATLESSKLVTGLKDMRVVFSCKDRQSELGYEKVKRAFPHAIFYKVNNIIPNHFKYLLSTAIRNSDSDYILLSKDSVIVNKPVNLSSCLEAMQRTQAYSFSLRMGSNIVKCYPYPWAQELPKFYSVYKDANQDINNNIFAWQLKYGYGDWAYPSNFEMSIYNKEKLYKLFRSLHYGDLDSLEICWSNVSDLDDVGLCFRESKVVKAVFSGANQSDVTEQLNLGFKLDVSLFEDIKNEAARVEYSPKFITLE